MMGTPVRAKYILHVGMFPLILPVLNREYKTGVLLSQLRTVSILSGANPHGIGIPGFF